MWVLRGAIALTGLGMGLKSNMPREQKGAGLFEAAGREAGSPARRIQ